MTIIFKAKTQEGYTFKILAELLQNIVKTACFKITPDGIFYLMTDRLSSVLVDVQLLKDRFNIFETTSTMHISFDIGNLFKMLKSIKKKDALTLYIDDEKPDLLNLVVHPKENNRVSSSSLRIQDAQNIVIPVPQGYFHPILMPSNEYQRTLKDMNIISKVLSIEVRRYSAVIKSVDENIYSKEVMFGELDDKSAIVSTDLFDNEFFLRTIKIAGLDKTLYLYSGPANHPLRITSNIGQIGKISLFIKSQDTMRRQVQST